jgi:hypothetical protein
MTGFRPRTYSLKTVLITQILKTMAMKGAQKYET